MEFKLPKAQWLSVVFSDFIEFIASRCFENGICGKSW